MDRFSFLFFRQAALPVEHGSWVFLFSPMVIGVAAAGQFRQPVMLVCLAGLSVFLARQPLTLLVKVLSHRRPSRDLLPALFWLTVYGVVGAGLAAWLIYQGFGFILWLALLSIPVLIWHLWLVSRRAERKNAPVEIAGSGVLALIAPAVYWAGIGKMDWTGGLLWGLCWLQATVSIHYTFFRLEQRRLESIPGFLASLRMGRLPLFESVLGLAAVVFLAYWGWISPWLVAAFAVQPVEIMWGIIFPAKGVQPAKIGIRQLAVSSLFTLIFVLAW